jgi:hypothetical protein
MFSYVKFTVFMSLRQDRLLCRLCNGLSVPDHQLIKAASGPWILEYKYPTLRSRE